MGCGKSKHAVETANTVVKSTNSDTNKETHTTKTVTEKGDSSLVQKEVETKSVFVEDTKKETVTTKLDPSVVAKTENLAPTSADNVVKENEKVKDLNPMDADVAPTTPENVGKASKPVDEDKKVKDFSPRDASDANTDNVEPTPSKDDMGVEKVVKDDEEKKEFTIIADPKAKISDMPPTKDEGIKESNVTKHSKAKTEFMTPTLSEDVVGALQVAKDDEEVKDSIKENTDGKISEEKSVKPITDSLDPKPEVKEQKVVAPPAELKKVETKEEDVEVNKAKIAIAEASLATEPNKVSTANEANAAEAQEKEPKTI